jgi:hypothetical protein
MARKQKKPRRKMTPAQRAAAKRSAKRHGRSRPGLWENVNASKGLGTRKRKSKSKPKGRTRPGKRSRTKKSGARRKRS